MLKSSKAAEGFKILQPVYILMSASYESNSNDLFREKGGVKTLLSKIREKFYHDA